jgi:hypothetical protein
VFDKIGKGGKGFLAWPTFPILVAYVEPKIVLGLSGRKFSIIAPINVFWGLKNVITGNMFKSTRLGSTSSFHPCVIIMDTTIMMWRIKADTQYYPCLFTQAHDFIEVQLDEYMLLELSNDLMHKWDATYSMDEFSPCHKVVGMIVDKGSN